MNNDSVHSHSTDGKRIICFLCGSPKFRWELVIELNQYICRACMNYEGTRLPDSVLVALEGLCKLQTRRGLKCSCNFHQRNWQSLVGFKLNCCQKTTDMPRNKSPRRPRAPNPVDTVDSEGVIDLTLDSSFQNSVESNTLSSSSVLRNMLSLQRGIRVPVVTGSAGMGPPFLTPMSPIMTTTTTRSGEGESVLPVETPRGSPPQPPPLQRKQ